jgi:signal transduction histidine kinase
MSATNLLQHPAVNGIVVNARDVTERRKLEEQLMRAAEDAIGTLSGGVAHDFNNILTVILGHAEVLMQALRSSPANTSTSRASTKPAVVPARSLASCWPSPQTGTAAQGLQPELADCGSGQNVAPLEPRNLDAFVAISELPRGSSGQYWREEGRWRH